MNANLLSTEAAAERLGISPRTLEKWRLSGQSPPYRKLGRAVRYAPEDLALWLADRRRLSTSDPGQRGGGAGR